MSDPRFRISLQRPREGVVVIDVAGEVDLCSSTSLREKLKRTLEAGSDLVVVDLTDVPFMDSSGLGCLVSAAHLAAASGSAFALVTGDGRVQRVITTTGIDSMIPVYGTREEALGQAGGDHDVVP